MKRKTTNFHRGLATACVLACATTVLGIGATALDAQSPSPMDTCAKDNSGSLCMEGEACFLFFCWGWEKYWPEAVEPEE